jgi:hypothetical protein
MKIKYLLYLFFGLTLFTSCNKKPDVVYIMPPHYTPTIYEQRQADNQTRTDNHRIFGPLRLDLSGWPYIPVQKKRTGTCLEKKHRSPLTKKVRYRTTQPCGAYATAIRNDRTATTSTNTDVYAFAHGNSAHTKARVQIIFRKKRHN